MKCFFDKKATAPCRLVSLGWKQWSTQINLSFIRTSSFEQDLLCCQESKQLLCSQVHDVHQAGSCTATNCSVRSKTSPASQAVWEQASQLLRKIHPPQDDQETYVLFSTIIFSISWIIYEKCLSLSQSSCTEVRTSWNWINSMFYNGKFQHSIIAALDTHWTAACHKQLLNRYF